MKQLGIVGAKEIPSTKELIPLGKGDIVKICFRRKGDKEFDFDARVIKKEYDSKHNVYYLIMAVEPNTNSKTGNKRKHVRLPVCLDVQYAMLVEDKGSLFFQKGIMVDISCSGARIATNERFPEDTEVVLIFTLPLRAKSEELELEATVRHCQEVDKYKKTYHIGLKFENITQREEDTIARFIFEQMPRKKR